MKAKVSTLLLAAVVASFTNSAEAAPPQKSRIPAPPPAPKVGTPTAAPAAPAPAKPAGPTYLEVAPGETCVSHSLKPQKYTAQVSLKPGQEKMPMLLVVSNGKNTLPFSWIRIKVNGEVLFTEAKLKGKREGIIDVSGEIPAGDSQVIVEAGGTPGATMSWQLATFAPAVTTVEPKTAAPGATVVLKGTGFAVDPNQVNVVVNDMVGDCLKTSPTSMTIKLPPDLKPGDATVSLQVNGLEPVQFPLPVAGTAAPVVSGVDIASAPPGTTVTIRGKYFSTNPSKNQVFFNGVAGQVTQAAADFLKVVVPAAAGVPASQQASASISVVSNGSRSANSLPFIIGNSTLDRNYRASARFPEAMTQNSSQSRNVSSSSATVSGHNQCSSDSRSEARLDSSSQSGGFAIVPIE